METEETPEMAAYRELDEETGLKTVKLSFWKRYERRHPSFIVDQYVYTGKTNARRESLALGEGQDIHFFSSRDIKTLKLAYGFDTLLNEYFLTREW